MEKKTTTNKQTHVDTSLGVQSKKLLTGGLETQQITVCLSGCN